MRTWQPLVPSLPLSRLAHSVMPAAAPSSHGGYLEGSCSSWLAQGTFHKGGASTGVVGTRGRHELQLSAAPNSHPAPIKPHAAMSYQ
jgi:hypothetical protein